MPDSSQPPLSIAQAAEESGIPKRTIQYQVSQGHIKAHKLPGSTAAWVIDRDDFEEWLAKREEAASA